MVPAGDAELIQIIDAALADATLRAGEWLACRPGCHQCCTGVFRISQLDAVRLRSGRDALYLLDSSAGQALDGRIHASQQRLAHSFPGSVQTGVLHADLEAEAAFEEFADDETCPVLDPLSGTCTLYTHRPLTCRTFGPPVRTEDGSLGVCELCFQGAPEQEIVAAEMYLPNLEMDADLSAKTGRSGETIVAFAFGD